MGKGREIGARLNRCVEDGSARGFSHQSLMGRLLDDLGGDTGLQAPLRDLAMRPLFLRSLQQERPALRQTAALSLSQELAEIYAPAVLSELLDLIETALAVNLPREDGPVRQPTPGGTAHPGGSRRAGATARPGIDGSVRTAEPARQARDTGPVPEGQQASRSLAKEDSAGPLLVLPAGAPAATRLLLAWRAIGPGLALAALMALVIGWLGGELDRLWLSRWNAAPLLVGLLLALQLLSAGPLKAWRREAPLRLEEATDPHRLRCWLSAPWLHRRHGEAVVNGLMLLAILGSSPLPLSQLLLRYALTSLATMALGVTYGLLRLRQGIWDGASGAVSALIALAAGLSLLQWRPMAFSVGPLELPAWVLFLTYGALQLRWLLPRLEPGETTRPRQRLLRSSWWWGTSLGLLWALLTRSGELLTPLLPRGAG